MILGARCEKKVIRQIDFLGLVLAGVKYWGKGVRNRGHVICLRTKFYVDMIISFDVTDHESDFL